MIRILLLGEIAFSPGWLNLHIITFIITFNFGNLLFLFFATCSLIHMHHIYPTFFCFLIMIWNYYFDLKAIELSLEVCSLLKILFECLNIFFGHKLFLNEILLNIISYSEHTCIKFIVYYYRRIKLSAEPNVASKI